MHVLFELPSITEDFDSHSFWRSFPAIFSRGGEDAFCYTLATIPLKTWTSVQYLFSISQWPCRARSKKRKKKNFFHKIALKNNCVGGYLRLVTGSSLRIHTQVAKPREGKQAGEEVWGRSAKKVTFFLSARCSGRILVGSLLVAFLCETNLVPNAHF